jgi:methylenetetrahydrofolate--tRNA-(uracil-5-)-methyltransferase
MKKINIVGAGLAGSEAALQFADAGWNVRLYEMRPGKQTEAHVTPFFAEIVCSNSFKSTLVDTASGLLKAEMKMLGTKILPLAEEHAVPAGNALAVDRDAFAEAVTRKIRNHPNIEVIQDEVVVLPEEKTIIATGPLTSSALTSSILQLIGKQQLYFFDAIAPIVSADSLNREIVFSKTRYDKGEADYLNCPFSEEEYYRFVDALNAGEKHTPHDFENEFFQNSEFHFYENCTPIEELARRGRDTLRFGVMRPVGLEDPRTNRRPYGVLQLRAENSEFTAYNLVGCQTMLRYPEQKSIFRLIPGLENAEILRYGSIHRNTYLNSPAILNTDFSLKNAPHIHIAGQLSGVEGYVESILSGLIVSRIILDNLPMPPATTITGGLWRHLLTPVDNFQPQNANYGFLPAIQGKFKNKMLKKQAYSERAIADMTEFVVTLQS